MKDTTIKFWDMDHTLIAIDSDVAWKRYLMELGLAPDNALEQADLYWDQYISGNLVINDFITFQLKEFKNKSNIDLEPLTQQFFEKFVKSQIYHQAFSIVRRSLSNGEKLCMITATNAVIAKPVADYFGFEHVIATMPEEKDGLYTGSIVGEYCGGKGKIPYIKAFCERFHSDLSQCYYYADSVADIVIMEAVGFPGPVNPMPELKMHAEKRGWDIQIFKNQ